GGLDEADVHAVNKDSLGPQLDRQGLGQAEAGCAVDRRGQEGRVRVAGVEGVDVDDPGRGAWPQVRQRGADAADLREQLHLDVVVPVVVGERGEPARPGPARVVDQDVEPAEGRGGGGDEVG